MAAPLPVIINAAISGSHPPTASPNLPQNGQQLGEQALEVAEAGAAIVHIHAREDNGEQSGKVEDFAVPVKYIKASGSNIIINLTTSFTAAGEDDHETRFAPLALKPDVASFDAGTMNFADWVFMNTPSFLRELAQRMQQASIKPEIEIFDAGQIGNAERIAAEGLIDGPLYFQFMLGVRGGAPATIKHLLHLRESLPKGAVWSVGGIGRPQLDMDAYGILMGGNVRTGLEDNLYLSKGVLATNRELVQRVADLVRTLGREVATPEQARNILGIS